MQPDNELLRRYASDKSEEAFAELVKRHVNLVYSAALRQAHGDTHLAHDVAQSVFTDLARKAASLLNRESLSGWLYTSAYFAANKMMRVEMRRRQREERFMQEPVSDHAPEADWEKLRPLLDAAMHGLRESDREAIVLRYFENRPYAEVGAKFGLNENAARLRVERALEKLRSVLAKQGIATATALGAIVSTNAVQVAPAHLAATLTATSITAASTGTLTFLQIMAATKLKLAAGTLAVACVTTALVVQHQAEAKLRSENGTLQQQLAQLKKQNEDISNSVLDAQNTQALSQEQLSELLKLRSQVGDLNRQLAEAAQARANPAATQSIETSTNDPETQDHVLSSRTMSAAHELADATVWRYAEHHNGRFPTNWNQVKEDYEAAARASLSPGDIVPDTAAEFAWATNEFEFAYQGSTKDLLALTNGYDMIVIREKQPWLRSDGKWVKTYGLADGSGQLRAASPGGFAAWESQRMVPPPTNQ
jgi:RNA polymerase sigma factor (sigma-70 family)